MKLNRVLVTEPIAAEGLELLRDGNLEPVIEYELSTAQLEERVAGFVGLVVRSQTRVTRPVLEAGHDLRIVGRAGVGLENIDLEAARERGIAVVNAPRGNSIATAEHTFAMMLALARQIPAADHSLRNRGWERSGFMGVELSAKVLGIMGMGRVGQAVARQASAFGMQVIAHDPFLNQEAAEALGVYLTGFDYVLSQSDFLTLHLPLVPDTRHIMNADTIGRMKPGARLINCARGALVDEAALLAALNNGWLAGAALDVFEQEPPQGPLLTHPAVVITPHLGASTVEAQVRVALEVARKIIDFLSGKQVSQTITM